jgi:hypothetical protein
VAKLSSSDPHHWRPVKSVVDWLASRLSPDAKVLEIGCSYERFPPAKTFVDFVDVPGVEVIKCDCSSERIPVEDKTFDFCYARHICEDMFNPFHLCAEMSRVARAGYIETPSPIAELCRGVDGGAPHYRGYHHHRYIIWEHKGQLRFISKYPLIEYLRLEEDVLASWLRQGARYWNTFYLWDGSINLKHVQSPLDFDIPRDYQRLLAEAALQAKASSDAFMGRIPDSSDSIASLPSNASAAA